MEREVYLVSNNPISKPILCDKNGAKKKFQRYPGDKGPRYCYYTFVRNVKSKLEVSFHMKGKNKKITKSRIDSKSDEPIIFDIEELQQRGQIHQDSKEKPEEKSSPKSKNQSKKIKPKNNSNNNNNETNLRYFLIGNVVRFISVMLNYGALMVMPTVITLWWQWKKKKKKQNGQLNMIDGSDMSNPTSEQQLPISITQMKTRLRANPQIRSLFRRYCKQEFSIENLSFWERVQLFYGMKSTTLNDQRRRKEEAAAIIDLFIRTGSAMEINTTQKVRTNILNSFEMNSNDSSDDKKEEEEEKNEINERNNSTEIVDEKPEKKDVKTDSKTTVDESKTNDESTSSQDKIPSSTTHDINNDNRNEQRDNNVQPEEEESKEQKISENESKKRNLEQSEVSNEESPAKRPRLESPESKEESPSIERHEKHEKKDSEYDNNVDEEMDSVDFGEPTKYIFVENFKRPLTENNAEDYLSQHGKPLDFWMNKIKSHCVAKYETEDIALSTLKSVHGKKWPSHGQNLEGRFVTRSEFEDIQSGQYQKRSKSPTPTENSEKRPSSVQDNPMELFKLTKTDPPIYYMPLTDEQIRQNKINPPPPPHNGRGRRRGGGWGRHRRGRGRR
eukprot:gb/GECH01004507.1/.p1 GENE.gb/GECH01004507.1/~~gb/GECH01004507.1/.p1  ORF type:complete len:615 (+),score=190.28 gb/GECH01004507.1/:1-1845(+)